MRLTVAASHTPNMDPDAARDDDAMSDYASSVTTSDFTSINSSRLQAIHQYAHGRYVPKCTSPFSAHPYPSLACLTNCRTCDVAES